jgi:hypothetical protein
MREPRAQRVRGSLAGERRSRSLTHGGRWWPASALESATTSRWEDCAAPDPRPDPRHLSFSGGGRPTAPDNQVNLSIYNHTPRAQVSFTDNTKRLAMLTTPVGTFRNGIASWWVEAWGTSRAGQQQQMFLKVVKARPLRHPHPRPPRSSSRRFNFVSAPATSFTVQLNVPACKAFRLRSERRAGSRLASCNAAHPPPPWPVPPAGLSCCVAEPCGCYMLPDQNTARP